MHTHIIAFDDNCENDMSKILHQAKMLKSFIQITKLKLDHKLQIEQYEPLIMKRLMIDPER